MKRLTTMSIDSDVLNYYKKMVNNVSQSVEDYMRQCNAMEDVEELDLLLVEKEIARLKNDKQVLDSRLSKKVEQLEQFKKRMEQKQIEEVEEQKQIEQKQKRCCNCGCELKKESKAKDFPKGKVCHKCYMDSDKAMRKMWGASY